MRFLLLLSTLIVSAAVDFLMPEAKSRPEAAKTAKVRTVGQTTDPKPVNYDLKYLTRGGWRMVSIHSDKPCDTDGDGVKTTDVYAETPACAKDDVMRIQDNRTVRFIRNKHCDFTEDDVETYRWTLSGKGVFTITGESVEAAMYLQYLDEKRLVMVVPMDIPGESYRFTITYEQTDKF